MIRLNDLAKINQLKMHNVKITLTGLFFSQLTCYIHNIIKIR